MVPPQSGTLFFKTPSAARSSNGGLDRLKLYCLFLRLMNTGKYEAVIGLEVHAQLNTRSKLFCGDSASFGGDPNTHISPITLAHPGTLPMMNKKAIESAVKLGLALGCEIEQKNYFARKNYFYPDLPKGYQVSQHTTPICKNGTVPIKVDGVERNILLNRIHIEEDAGKSIHDIDEDYTCIDLNRAGVPLLEIVSEPDLHSAEEAFAYVTELRKLVRWISICDGNMEEGSMRCDANISIRLIGEKKLGTRVEVKNLNSIRNVKRAIDYEIARLIEMVENGEPIQQQTRSFEADKGTTFALRSKEEADDYRYFPEPDLTPFHITDEFMAEVKSSIPELSAALQKKYVTQFGLTVYDAQVICDDKETADFYELLTVQSTNYKAAANWLSGPVKSWLNENNQEITRFPLAAGTIAKLIVLVDDNKVNFSTASSRIFSVLLKDPSKDPLQLANELNLIQESDTAAIENWVDQVLAGMPDKVAEYKKGKKGLIGLFTGEVKKLSKGKADVKLANALLEKKLSQ